MKVLPECYKKLYQLGQFSRNTIIIVYVFLISLIKTLMRKIKR
jgi:hypothetical protein